MMKDLTSRLTRELQQGFNVKIMDTMSWSLPVHSIEISYETVTKTKMDILMKMMLIVFQKAEIETAKELSEILLVEQLFIEDLMNKMTNARMIEKVHGIFVLTATGQQQLETGIFEHEPESGSTEGLYSPCHESFLSGELENSRYETAEKYRYQDEFEDWKITTLEKKSIIDMLKKKDIEKEEGNVQLIVSKVISATDRKTTAIPCIEFRLYNKEEDLMYARVWNTLTERWDEIIEAQLNDKERKQWRAKYLEE